MATKRCSSLFLLPSLLPQSRLQREEKTTCALTKMFECYPDEGCQLWSVDEMYLPRFVSIDLGAKTATSLTVLHGTESRGGSITLANDGDLTWSASGDGEGFVVFRVWINQ